MTFFASKHIPVKLFNINSSHPGTLVDKTGTKQCEDKNGTMFPIDPIFDAGCVSNTWIVECSDEKIIRYDLKIGIDTAYPGQDVWGSVRLVSKPGEASAKIGEEPSTPKPTEGTKSLRQT